MMKIEITIGNEDPQIYVIPDSKIILGKDPECDVVVLDPKVSRRHVEVKTLGGRFFITDLGSTNGTYINEEKISEGKSVEFFSFFPVRLGTNVLLTLVEENENKPLPIEHEEKTQIVSLKDLHSANTSRLVKNRKKNLNKKDMRKAGARLISLKDIIIRFFNLQTTLAYIAIGLAIFITLNRKNEVQPPEVDASPMVIKPEEKAVVEERRPIPFEILDKTFEEAKCTGELEKEVCDSLSFVPEKPWGAKIKHKTIYIQVNASKYYLEALKMLQGSKGNISNEVWEVAAALFLSEGITSNLDYVRIKDFSLIVTLYLKSEKTGLAAMVRINSESLENVKVLLDRSRLQAIVSHGVDVIDFTKNYYSVSTVD